MLSLSTTTSAMLPARWFPQVLNSLRVSFSDRLALEKLLTSGFDGVMHFAALIEAGESMKKPEIYFRNNSASTLTLIEAMLATNVRRLVFSSTAAVYGEPESTPIREDAPLHPTNAYGESKLLVEKMLTWMYRIYGFPYASLRYFNVAGAAREPVRLTSPSPTSSRSSSMWPSAAAKKSKSTATNTQPPTVPASAITFTSRTSPGSRQVERQNAGQGGGTVCEGTLEEDVPGALGHAFGADRPRGAQGRTLAGAGPALGQQWHGGNQDRQQGKHGRKTPFHDTSLFYVDARKTGAVSQHLRIS